MMLSRLESAVTYNSYGSRLLPVHPGGLNYCSRIKDECSGNNAVCSSNFFEELSCTCEAHRCCSKLLVQLVSSFFFFLLKIIGKLILAGQRRLVYADRFRTKRYPSDSR